MITFNRSEMYRKEVPGYRFVSNLGIKNYSLGEIFRSKRCIRLYKKYYKEIKIEKAYDGQGNYMPNDIALYVKGKKKDDDYFHTDQYYEDEDKEFEEYLNKLLDKGETPVRISKTEFCIDINNY